MSEATAMNLAREIIGSIDLSISLYGTNYKTGIAVPRECYEKIEKMIDAWYLTHIYEEVTKNENAENNYTKLLSAASELNDAVKKLPANDGRTIGLLPIITRLEKALDESKEAGYVEIS